MMLGWYGRAEAGFGELGWGVWFRYFAGVVEVVSAALVMVPRLALVGFGLLAVTMAAAVGLSPWCCTGRRMVCFRGCF
jgi:hypothetical protein